SRCNAKRTAGDASPANSTFAEGDPRLYDVRRRKVMSKNNTYQPANRNGTEDGQSSQRDRREVGSDGFSGMEPGPQVNEVAGGEPSGQHDYFEEQGGAREAGAEDEDEAERQRSP